MKEIETKEDVTFLVNTFYSKVLQDETLKPFFKDLDFPAHLPRMVHFWCFVLLDERDYKTNVTEKHLHMPLQKEHFERWLYLFKQTIDEHFTGEKAELAKQRATVIAWTISNKMGLN